MILVLTTASGPRLPQVRVLLDGLRRLHPELGLRVLLADRLGSEQALGLAPEELVSAPSLGLPTLATLAFGLERDALAAALLPRALLQCLAQPDCEAVICLQDCCALEGRLEPILAALADGADTVLLAQPSPTTAAPDDPAADLALLRRGLIDTSCLAVRAGTAGRALAAWWQSEILGTDEAGAMAAPPNGESRWLDLAHCFVERCVVLRHAGLGVTPAAAAARGLERTAHGWRVGDEALLLARFPDGELAVGEAGAALLETWQEQVAAAAVSTPPQPYAFDFTTTGTPIPPVLRRFYGAVLAPQVSNPFTPTPEWFALPAENLSLQPGESFNRFAQFVHDEPGSLAPQSDLRQPAARAALADWLQREGFELLNLSPPMRALALLGLRGASAAAGGGGSTWRPLASGRASNGERLVGAIWRLRWAYRHLPPRLRRATRRQLLQLTGTRQSLLVGDAAAAGPTLRPAVKPDPALPSGAILLGYPEAELGLGQALRGLAQGLIAARVPLRLANFGGHIVAHEQRERSLSHLIDNRATARAQVFCINADQLPPALAEIGQRRVRAAFNIAYPFWELPRLPDIWVPNFNEIDEVWAPTRFIQDSLQASLRKTVTHIGVGVQLRAPAPLGRRDFGIAEDRYAFLFFFDYSSYASRKNPEAVIEAFTRAFPPEGGAPVTLVLKAMGRELEVGRRLQLAALVERDPRICLIDRVLQPAEQSALLGLADALVSLHRSEGFGLGMAEALLLGKAVVATGFGGCMDFLTPDNACLVDHRLIDVEPGQYPHGDGQQWADPDLDQAADYLRRLVADPALGRRLGAQGQIDIKRDHTPAVVGRRAAARLRELGLAP